MKRAFKIFGIFVVVLVVVVLLLRLFVFDLAGLEGDEMWPTLGPGAWVLVKKGSDVERGDLILFELENGTPQIRRVIGLPGETVSVDHAEARISGVETAYTEVRRFMDAGREYKVLRETIGGRSWEIVDDTRRKRTLPERSAGDGYYVLADHREHGRDSGHYGPVKKEHIRGVVVHVIGRGKIPGQ